MSRLPQVGTHSGSELQLPLVSILTPSFNQGRFIADCLASVAMQTYRNVEHIVMDGGSSDDTVAKLKAWSGAGLRWTSEGDRGQSHALLKALDVSKGDIVGWVNSDDGYATASIVERVVKGFAASPHVGVIYSDTLVVDSVGEVLHVLVAPRDLRIMDLGSRVYQPSVFTRRQVLIQHGFVDEAFEVAMDYDLLTRLRAHGVEFRYIDAVGAVDRHHAARKVERQSLRLRTEVDLVRPSPGLVGRLHWRASNVALRLKGVTMTNRVYRDPLLPMWKLPPKPTFFARQVLLPRRFQG